MLFPEEPLPWQMKILIGGHPSDLCHADGLGSSFVSLNMNSLWYHKGVTSSLCGSAWRSSSTELLSHFLANSSSLHLLTLITSCPWGMIVCNTWRSCQGAPQKKAVCRKDLFLQISLETSLLNWSSRQPSMQLEYNCLYGSLCCKVIASLLCRLSCPN